MHRLIVSVALSQVRESLVHAERRMAIPRWHAATRWGADAAIGVQAYSMRADAGALLPFPGLRRCDGRERTL
jgi:hypothetical protein